MLSAIDTNIISALWSKESASEGVASLLFNARQQGGLVICAAVYCELLAYLGADKAFVERFLGDTDIQIDYNLSEVVWQAAGETFATNSYTLRSVAGRIKPGSPNAYSLTLSLVLTRCTWQTACSP